MTDAFSISNPLSLSVIPLSTARHISIPRHSFTSSLRGLRPKRHPPPSLSYLGAIHAQTTFPISYDSACLLPHATIPVHLLDSPLSHFPPPNHSRRGRFSCVSPATDSPTPFGTHSPRSLVSTPQCASSRNVGCLFCDTSRVSSVFVLFIFPICSLNFAITSSLRPQRDESYSCYSDSALPHIIQCVHFVYDHLQILIPSPHAASSSALTDERWR